MDIEISYLKSDGGRRFHELSHDRQVDYLAYWICRNGTDPGRAMLQAPATYQDLLQALLVSRSKDPAVVAAEERPAPKPTPRRPKPRAVKVIGGTVSEETKRHVAAMAAPLIMQDWVKRTGTDPDVLARALAKKG